MATTAAAAIFALTTVLATDAVANETVICCFVWEYHHLFSWMVAVAVSCNNLR